MLLFYRAKVNCPLQGGFVIAVPYLWVAPISCNPHFIGSLVESNEHFLHTNNYSSATPQLQNPFMYPSGGIHTIQSLN
jgi:hypothetical protein